MSLKIPPYANTIALLVVASLLHGLDGFTLVVATLVPIILYASLRE